jgi:hypothetical protein
MRILTALAVTGALALGAPAAVHALPELAISPAVLELKVAPGQAVTTEIVVQNPGTVPYRVTVYTWDMWHDGRERRYGPPGTFPRSLAQRVAAAPATFALTPGNKQAVQITLDVPVDATGGHYAVVFFEMTPAGPVTSGPGPVLAIAGRIGASVIVDTATTGATLRVGHVDSVAIEPPTATAPLRVATAISNPTDTHLRPYAAAVILKDKKPIGRFTLPSILLLPGQQGVLEGSWSGALRPGEYTVLLTVVSSDGKAETLERRFSVD